jgi:sarcosine oxidase subunit alpha
MHHRRLDVAGVRCHALLLGFAGELGYELHHDRSDSGRLWDALLDAGRDLRIRPHGLEALRLLRLEKAHIIVGQDTDFDSTPAKLGLAWAVRTNGGDFIGRAALERISRLPLELRLARVTFGSEAPAEGTPLSAGGRHAGHLTSSRFSPVLDHGVALGWVRAENGTFPEEVDAAGSTGRVVSEPFYDPRGERLRA